MPLLESPTSKGLFIMFLSGIFILIGFVGFPPLAVIGWIISGVGFFMVFGDRYAYPEPHPTNMKFSLFFYISGIIMLIVGGISLFIGALSGFPFDFYYEESTPIGSIFFIIVTISITILGSVFMFLGRYKLLVELLPPDKKGLLRFAMIFVLVSIVLVLLFFYMIVRSRLEFIVALMPLLGIVLLAAINHILFLYLFYSAHDHQKRNPQLRMSSVPVPPQIPTQPAPQPSPAPVPPPQHYQPQYSYPYPYPNYYQYPHPQYYQYSQYPGYYPYQYPYYYPRW
jgi:MFS family permease